MFHLHVRAISCAIAVFILALTFAPHPSAQPAAPSTGPITLAIVNAHIWTGDTAQPWADALAVRGEEIVAVGTNDDIRRVANMPGATVPADRAIDAGGRLVVPGLVDAHVHFLEGGFRLLSVKLRDAKTREEFVARIKAYAATVPPGTWITGGDWDHTLWGGELPRRDWIDAVTPNNPVWVTRLDGHMSVANSAALRAAGITRDTKDVPGGEIVRDASGEPAGVFKDNATRLVERAIPPPSPEVRDRALLAATRYVAAQGVTSVHNMGDFEDLDTFARARRAGTLMTRIYSAVPLSQWERLRDLVASRQYGADGRGDDWVRIGGLKGFVDGSLGSHTAAFFQPFDDAPNDRGLLVNTPEDLYRWVSGADKAKLNVMVHAIGDRAIALMLDTYDRVIRENGARDRRFRIEHAQHPAAPDIPRFAALGIIASMQPYHAIDDGRWAEKYIGARINTTYAFKSFLDAGVTLAFGSDWFVAPPTPLEGIYAAVTRRTLDGRNPGGWVPEQKITVEQALRAYTAGSARASFDESRKGALSPRRLADFVVLDRNIFEIPPEEIRDVKVRMTFVGGTKVFDATLAATAAPR